MGKLWTIPDNVYKCYFGDILSRQPAFAQQYIRIHIEGRLEGSRERCNGCYLFHCTAQINYSCQQCAVRTVNC